MAKLTASLSAHQDEAVASEARARRDEARAAAAYEAEAAVGAKAEAQAEAARAAARAASDDFRAREARASEALGHQASALASLQQRHQEEVASLQEKVRAPPPAQALLCGEHHGATSNQEHGKQNTIMPHVWNLYL